MTCGQDLLFSIFEKCSQFFSVFSSSNNNKTSAAATTTQKGTRKSPMLASAKYGHNPHVSFGEIWAMASLKQCND